VPPPTSAAYSQSLLSPKLAPCLPHHVLATVSRSSGRELKIFGAIIEAVAVSVVEDKGEGFSVPLKRLQIETAYLVVAAHRDFRFCPPQLEVPSDSLLIRPTATVSVAEDVGQPAFGPSHSPI
jgi:hypothetical protein